MAETQRRCDGAFLGLGLASQFDGSTQMAIQLSESLLELKAFDRPQIMSKYISLSNSAQHGFGEVATSVWSFLKAGQKSNVGNRSASSTSSHLFSQEDIDAAVQLVDKKLKGLTAACGPAHRSFPLAFCPWIDDDDLFEVSMQEAALTHANPIAGQVAGIVNLICRALLKNQTWDDAINVAFATPGLHGDVGDICMRYCRYNPGDQGLHPAYAPAALNAALYYVTNSNDVQDAIQKAKLKEQFYCVNIVGILAGVRWGVPVEVYRNLPNGSQIRVLRDTASRMSRLWTGKSGTFTA